ncbi:ABC transporter permease [Saccharococcus sp. Marseille-Q5394]|uniref:ABC transporter permease n=1 Tax=Saccharococcus sp. Marseille-Q5394 TaxID=2972778 RepID=UPI0021C69B8A|nr:ABC transporter permease [Saccharococcus sp. Marseille-Q5394]
MLNLLAAERIKLFRRKKLYIVLGILFFLPIMQAVSFHFEVLNGKEPVQIIETVINGATAILMIKKNGLTILLVLSAFISFLIGEEFHNGTIRNALSLGRSRTHYYLTKLAVAASVSIVSVIGLTLIGMISYSIAFGFGGIAEITNYTSYSLKTFGTLTLLLLSSVSIYVMISFLTKNSSFSLIWSFLYTIATGFLPSLFQQTEHFQHMTNWFSQTFLFYWDFAQPETVTQYPEMILVSVVTIVLSSAVGILLFTRTDIK